MQKQNFFLCQISVLMLAIIGVCFLSGLFPVATLADNSIPQGLAGSSVPSRITPEIREILQRNNFQAARYENPAPDFALRSLDGEIVQLSQFRGEVVLLGFFTTW